MHSEYQTAERMAKKLAAIPLPEFVGKSVLDVGCDFGAWSFLAADRGASKVLGLDRNRDVRGVGPVDLIQVNREAAAGKYPQCEFQKVNIGRQWKEYGRFDVVLCLSLYHHIYQCAGGDHEPVWFWLWRHTGGELLWENPLDTTDSVVRGNVQAIHHANYNREAILAAANRYFEVDEIGKGHVSTRTVLRCTPRELPPNVNRGTVKPGAGGASKAFNYANERRICEIEQVLGVRCLPGSLNVHTERLFDFDRGYYRAQILDVMDRAQGLAGAWSQRWCRFYPVSVAEDVNAWAMRFEGERYPKTLVELIAPTRLSDHGREVLLCR